LSDVTSLAFGAGGNLFAAMAPAAMSMSSSIQVGYCRPRQSSSPPVCSTPPAWAVYIAPGAPVPPDAEHL